MRHSWNKCTDFKTNIKKITVLVFFPCSYLSPKKGKVLGPVLQRGVRYSPSGRAGLAALEDGPSHVGDD